MFSKLKELAQEKMLPLVSDKLSSIVSEKVLEVTALGAEKISNDELFEEHFIAPTWLGVEASIAGLTKLYPSLQEKFSGVMMHLRDELIIIEEGKVSLAQDMKERLPSVILEGLKK